MTLCPICSGEVTPGTRGHKKIYCSAKCRATATRRRAGIPSMAESRSSPEFSAKMRANALIRWAEKKVWYYDEEKDIVG